MNRFPRIRACALALVLALLAPTLAPAAVIAAAPRQDSAAPAPAPQQEITEIKIPAGTKIEVESAHTVSSKDLKEGEAITFTTILPLIIDGKTVIEKGAIVTARVTKAKKGGSWGRAGQLAFSMQDVVAVDNSRIPLEFAQAGKGDSKGGTVATGAIVTGLVFFPAAPLWGFKKGKNAVIPQGKRLEVMIHADATVKVPASK
jgi:hypothetical protein